MPKMCGKELFKKAIKYVHSEQSLARIIFLDAEMAILVASSRSFLQFDFGINWQRGLQYYGNKLNILYT